MRIKVLFIINKLKSGLNLFNCKKMILFYDLYIILPDSMELMAWIKDTELLLHGDHAFRN